LFELRDGRDGQFEVGGDALALAGQRPPSAAPPVAAIEFSISMQLE